MPRYSWRNSGNPVRPDEIPRRIIQRLLSTTHMQHGAPRTSRIPQRPQAPGSAIGRPPLPRPRIDEPAKNALTCTDVTSGENLAL